jgi:inhibitor of the pro-sigma K processing machinery
MQYLIFFGCIIAVVIIAKILSWPFKIIFKLLINIILGGILLVVVNILGAGFGLHIPFNAITALTSGILGIPGVILLIILQYVL